MSARRTTQARTGAYSPAAAPARRPIRATASLLAVALIAGLALGRFLFVRPTVESGGAPAAVSMESQLTDLERAVQADPHNAATWRRLAMLATYQAGVQADPVLYRLAERALTQAERLAGDDPLNLIARGQLQLGLHRFRVALRTGRAAHASLPQKTEPLGILVDAQVELGRYAAAAENLQTMLDLDPGLPALTRTSYLRELDGDLDGALGAMQQAFTAGSQPLDLAATSTLLGDLYLRTGAVDAARDAYAEAERLVPGHLPAVVGRARTLAAQGALREATRTVRAATQQRPQPAALILLAELLGAQGRTAAAEHAQSLARAVTKLQAQAGQVVDLEAALFEADQPRQPERAVRLARRAHEARPNNIFAADALAWALHGAGRSEAALPLSRAALRLGSVEPALRYHAAVIESAAGEPARARRHLRRLFAGQPWFTLRYRAGAAALAQRLGVEAPRRWRP